MRHLEVMIPKAIVYMNILCQVIGHGSKQYVTLVLFIHTYMISMSNTLFSGYHFEGS